MMTCLNFIGHVSDQLAKNATSAFINIFLFFSFFPLFIFLLTFFNQTQFSFYFQYQFSSLFWQTTFERAQLSHLVETMIWKPPSLSLSIIVGYYVVLYCIPSECIAAKATRNPYRGVKLSYAVVNQTKRTWISSELHVKLANLNRAIILDHFELESEVH